MKDLIEQYGKGLVIKKDELTAIERMKLFDEGKPIDRIPCCLDTGETMAPLMGLSIDDYYHSSQLMCDLEVYLYENFHSDGAGLSTTLRGMAEAMGSQIRYYDNNIAQLKQPAVPSWREVDGAKLVDVDKDGRLPIILEGLRLVKQKLGDKVPISGTVTGPFTIAAMVMGTEQLMIGSSTALISVKQYETFSLPYFQKNVDFIKKQGAGCGLHICGTSRALWELLKKTGIGTFGLDNVEDMQEAKEVLGSHMCIQGNVPPVEVMRMGTPQDVLRSARECIRKAYDSPKGFVLTSGCQMPMGTPRENMTALMDAARIFGSYPLQMDLLFDEAE